MVAVMGGYYSRENPRVNAEATTAVLCQSDDPIAHCDLISDYCGDAGSILYYHQLELVDREYMDIRL